MSSPISQSLLEISMPRRHRAISAFLIMVTSLIFLAASAYTDYNSLLEADFLTRGLKFEACDIADISVDKSINLNFVPIEFSSMGSLENDLHGLFIVSFPVSIVPPSSVLRC